MKPKLGRKYSRQQISKMLGGQTHHYLPFKNGEVLCGCFIVSPEKNPGAPEEVLFGTGPVVGDMAEMVYDQGSPTPIFIFRCFGAVGVYRRLSLR